MTTTTGPRTQLKRARRARWQALAVVVATAAGERATSAQTLAPPPPMTPTATAPTPAARPAPTATAPTTTLAPPPPLDATLASPSGDDARRRATEAELDRARAEDSGRGVSWFWVDGGAGGAFVDLGKPAGSGGISHRAAFGPVVDFGAGVQLLALTVGARARFMPMGPFALWNVGGEIAFQAPGRFFVPYIALRGGYLTTTRVAEEATATAAKNEGRATGGSFGANGGADYYVNRFFSVGLNGSADVLFVKQRANAASGTATVEGASTGVAAALVARLGVHL